MTSVVAESNYIDEVPDGHRVLAILDREGDTKFTWNPENADEVANARRTFDDLRAKGMVAYSVTKKGKKGEVVTTFDPDAEKLILAPALRGG